MGYPPPREGPIGWPGGGHLIDVKGNARFGLAFSLRWPAASWGTWLIHQVPLIRGRTTNFTSSFDQRHRFDPLEPMCRSLGQGRYGPNTWTG